MKYQALYRKYRPTTFKDVAGQTHIIRTVKNAIATDKVSHAYLFSGPRGTGKTTTAKLLAKAVNCEGYDGIDACGVCPSCVAIASNSTPDIIEIDAASNNGVDEIRELRDKVKYAPSNAKFKVYIIDEVHMLSTGAFNALLKTLEEPPSHVIFVLATTEPHKIPLTIISRCQRFDFKKLNRESIEYRLNQICIEEEITVEENVLKLIAKIADGGMRDAIGILDQSVAFAEGSVSLSDVYELTGVVSIEMLEKIVHATIIDDKVACLKLISEFNNLGKDVVRLAEDIVLFFRDMVLYKHLPNIDEVSENVYTSDKLAEIAGMIDEDIIYQAIEKLGQAISDMRYSSNPKIVLEMTMLSLIDFEKPIVQMKPVVKEAPAVKAVSIPVTEPTTKPIEEKVEEQTATIVEDVSETPVEPSLEQVTEAPTIEPQQISEEVIKETEGADAVRTDEFDDDLLNFEEAKVEDIVAPVFNEMPTVDEPSVQELDAEKVRELIKRADELRQEVRDVRINNVLALAHKPELELYKSKWHTIKSYSTDPIFGKIANLIGSSNIVVASGDGILITFEHQPMAERVMDKLELVEKLIEIIYSRSAFVVAVTAREWVSIKDDYILKSRRGQKYTVKDMPSLDEIKRIDHEIRTSKVKEDPIIQKALDLDFIDEEILTIED